MTDEIEEALRQRLGSGARTALYLGLILIGLVLTWLRWGGFLDIQGGWLFGPVLVLMGVVLLVRDVRRR